MHFTVPHVPNRTIEKIEVKNYGLQENYYGYVR